MIVSTAIAVLPVWRSPMISSRCPRPMGIIASMALIPVCSGSLTGILSTTPGATRSLAVNGLAERIHHAADHLIAHWNRHDAAGALHLVAFLDDGVIAEQNGSHLVFFQVHCDAGHSVRKLDQL